VGRADGTGRALARSRRTGGRWRDLRLRTALAVPRDIARAALERPFCLPVLGPAEWRPSQEVVVAPIATSKALEKESLEMQHCAAEQLDDALYGASFFFAATVRDARLTIKVTRKGDRHRLREVRGWRNRAPTSDEIDALVRWCEALGIELDRAALPREPAGAAPPMRDLPVPRRTLRILGLIFYCRPLTARDLEQRYGLPDCETELARLCAAGCLELRGVDGDGLAIYGPAADRLPPAPEVEVRDR
jgi:hypothetical protein